MRRIIVGLSVALSAGVLVFSLACSAQSQQPQGSAQGTKIGTRVGEQVPDFSIRLTDRSTVTSADLVSTGKPVFLYFFATW